MVQISVFHLLDINGLIKLTLNDLRLLRKFFFVQIPVIIYEVISKPVFTSLGPCFDLLRTIPTFFFQPVINISEVVFVIYLVLASHLCLST